jgi:hypothetical protein
MRNYKSEADDLLNEYKAELKAEIIELYLKNKIVDIYKFRSICLGRVSLLRGTYSGGHSIENLFEQAQADIWFELGTNTEMYL